MSIRVLSVDDHAIVQDGLAAALAPQPEIEWAGAVNRIEEALPAVTALQPDIVLLDLWVGTDQSWSTCASLASLADPPSICFFSGYGNPQLLDRAMRSGASGYVLKSTAPAELAPILRMLVDGSPWWQPELLAAWTREYRNRTGPHLFTHREIEIIELIAAGLDNFAIAETLHVSPHTVKYHIAKALRRMGEPNRTALVRRATADHAISMTDVATPRPSSDRP